MSLRVIIPARYGSTRLPAKPLLPICGVPLLRRVWAVGVSAFGTENVVVATDDERIADFCKSFGAQYVMTDPAIPNGSLRAQAALAQLPGKIDHVINLQGDAVLTPPWVIRAIAETLEKNSDVEIATPAVVLTKATYEMLREAKAKGEVGGTTVTFDVHGNALYFSKTIIPFIRDNVNTPVYRHIGLYGYRREALDKLVTLPETPLERAEKLEQLRALEHGMKIRVVVVDYRGRSHIGVDSEGDRQRAEQLIKAEGELLPTFDGSYRYQA